MLAHDEILFEDKNLLVINKPCGVPTAGDTLEQPGSLQHALMTRQRRMVWAVHQLDRDTSGVNLFVKKKSLVAPLTSRMQRGHKDYLLWCAPLPPDTPDHVVIREPLDYLPELRRHGVTQSGKSAMTELFVLARCSRATLCLARLHTGRTHQIRAHLQHFGAPLLGDARYGTPQTAALAPRQALHAWRLTLLAERDKKSDAVMFTAPLPVDLLALHVSLFDTPLEEALGQADTL